jgi:transcriptional regulator with XRE-family HTH domain
MNTDSTSTHISGVVSQLLADAGVSQKRAAEVTGIPRATLIRRLSGVSPFQTTELVALAALLGVNVSDIVLAAEQAAA